MFEANVFIVVNLGCEMLYVIDQRLKAQDISLDKSTQVMRDITAVLLDPKFIERLILGSHNKVLITPEHCKFMLNDIACCSLMRLDEASMGKLWDLMTMIFKWQLFVSKYPQHLLDITFRHLDGVGQLYPEVKKSILVDYTKNNILDLWNSKDSLGQEDIFKTTKTWLSDFSVKISILIRLGFQLVNASFVKISDEPYFQEFVETTGENIYIKSADLVDGKRGERLNAGVCGAIDDLAEQIRTPIDENVGQGLSLLFDDLLLNVEPPSEEEQPPEFVEIRTSRNPSNSWEDMIVKRNSVGNKDLFSLLNTELS